jgi:3-oxoacid CoA-transferase
MILQRYRTLAQHRDTLLGLGSSVTFRHTRRVSSKVYQSAAEAVLPVKSDDVLLAGGFGLCGLPNTLINALAERKNVRNLTAVSNNAGAGGRPGGLGTLLEAGQISKVILSYIGT